MDLNKLFQLKTFADRLNFLNFVGAKFVSMIDQDQVLYQYGSMHIQLSGPYCAVTDISSTENQIAIGFTSVDARRTRQVLQNLYQVDRDSVAEEVAKQISKQVTQSISVTEAINAHVQKMLSAARVQEKINDVMHTEAKELAIQFIKNNFKITKL